VIRFKLRRFKLRRFNLLLAPLAALPLLLASCSGPDVLGCRSGYQLPNQVALKSELSAARTRWQAAGIQSYSYEFARFAAPSTFSPFRITVQAGKVIKVENLKPQPGDPVPALNGTMEQRFGELEQGLAVLQDEQCGTLSINFDVTDGHALKQSFGTELVGIEDGVGGWTISNFTKL
jgi:Family of unknown function (DUF6174)